MDIGLSVIAYKKKDRRIDVDADDLIYHLKVSSPPLSAHLGFVAWGAEGGGAKRI